MGEDDLDSRESPGLKHRQSLLSFHSGIVEEGTEDPTLEPTMSMGGGEFFHVRWLVLFLSCWIMFGNYYAFDNPSALNRSLRRILAPSDDADGGLFQYRFGLLYSVYSVPNVVLPFFVGHWLDQWGTGVILTLLSGLVAGGQLVVALGIGRTSFPLILLGRILFGLGGESLAVAQARVVTEWFQDRELALAIGLNLSIARIGTVVNNVASPWIAHRWDSVEAAFWVGFLSCVISLVCTMATIWVDMRYRHLRVQRRSSYAATCAGGMIRDNGGMGTDGVDTGPGTLSRIRANFHSSFWILSLICFLFYGCMIPYNNVASDYLQTRYFTDDPIAANMAMSIPDTLAMFLIPVMGHYVDRLGRKMSLIALGAACFIAGHGMLAWGASGGVCLLALITLGFAYSTLLSFWACVPRLVRFVRHSTAYGVLTSACNLSVTVISLTVAPLVAQDPSYRTAGLFFAGLGVASLLLVLLLSSINLHRRLGLDTPVSAHIHGEDFMSVPSATPLRLVAEVPMVVEDAVEIQAAAYAVESNDPSQDPPPPHHHRQYQHHYPYLSNEGKRRHD